MQLALRDRNVVLGGRVVLAPVCPHGTLHDERQHGHAVPGVLGREALGEKAGDVVLDIHVVDVRQRPALEVRTHMALQDAPIATPCRGAQFGRRGPPSIGPLLEGDAGQLGVDPLTPTHVVLDVGEKGAGVGLAVEGLAAGTTGLVPIAGTPATIAFVYGAHNGRPRSVHGTEKPCRTAFGGLASEQGPTPSACTTGIPLRVDLRPVAAAGSRRRAPHLCWPNHCPRHATCLR